MSDVRLGGFVVTVTSPACGFDELCGNHRQLASVAEVLVAHDSRLRSYASLVSSLDRREFGGEPKKGGFFRYIGREPQPEWNEKPARQIERGESGALAVADLQALPAEEARIQRQHARSEQSKGGAERPDHEDAPAVLRMRERMPKRTQRQERAGYGRPQSNHQERTQSHKGQVQEAGHER